MLWQARIEFSYSQMISFHYLHKLKSWKTEQEASQPLYKCESEAISDHQRPALKYRSKIRLNDLSIQSNKQPEWCNAFAVQS